MSDFYLKRGDTSPAIKYQLQDHDGNAVDISGAEVRFIMEDHSGTVIIDDDTNGNVSIIDATNGQVKYDWQSSDTRSSGFFLAEWEVTFSNGAVETWPNSHTLDIQIKNDLE